MGKRALNGNPNTCVWEVYKKKIECITNCELFKVEDEASQELTYLPLCFFKLFIASCSLTLEYSEESDNNTTPDYDTYCKWFETALKNHVEEERLKIGKTF